MNLRNAWISVAVVGCLGCASRYELKPANDGLVLQKPAAGIVSLRSRLIQVDEVHGRSMVMNRRHYLVDFFRPSKDPYFGGDRWSEECLARNQIGSLEDRGERIEFRANLTSGDDLKAGTCTHGDFDIVQLTGFCRESRTFFEVTLRGEGAAGVEYECPTTLKLGENK